MKRFSLPPMDVNLTKFFGSCGIALLFIFGLTFTHEYLAGFGIPLLGAELGWPQATLIGSLWVMELGAWKLLLVVLSCFAIASVLIWAGSYFCGKMGMYAAVSVSFLALCSAAGVYGVDQGRKMQRAVVAGDAGFPAACKLKESAWGGESAPMMKEFEGLSDTGQVRFVLRMGSMMYFTFTNQSISEKFHGQTFVVNTSDVAYCRVFGR